MHIETIMRTSPVIPHTPARARDRLPAGVLWCFPGPLGTRLSMKWIGATIAIVILNVAMFLVIDISRYSWAPTLWSVYILGTWLLFSLRKWRFCRTSRLTEHHDRHRELGISELVGAIGLSSGLVAAVLALLTLDSSFSI